MSSLEGAHSLIPFDFQGFWENWFFACHCPMLSFRVAPDLKGHRWIKISIREYIGHQYLHPRSPSTWFCGLGHGAKAFWYVTLRLWCYLDTSISTQPPEASFRIVAGSEMSLWITVLIATEAQWLYPFSALDILTGGSYTFDMRNGQTDVSSQMAFHILVGCPKLLLKDSTVRQASSSWAQPYYYPELFILKVSHLVNDSWTHQVRNIDWRQMGHCQRLLDF